MSDKPVIVDGVKLDLTADDFADIDVIEQAAISADDGASDAEKLAASVKMVQLLFGDRYADVKDKLREANGGHLTYQQMQEFVRKAAEAVRAKN